MTKNNLTIAVHSDGTMNGGVYNVLSGFSLGLLKGFREIGVQAYTTKECAANDIKFNLAIGFNTSGKNLWKSILNSNIPNIMWSVDSVFAANFDIIEEYSHKPNFIVFGVTPADTPAINEFIPDLKHSYFPHAVDLDLWKKQDVEKENDIVFMSSITDYEAELANLKAQVPEQVYSFIMDIMEFSLQNPDFTFWQVFQYVQSSYGISLDLEQYLLLFQNITFISMHIQKVKMIQALSDFDVKVYGNGPWEKYIKGKVKYMGSCDVRDSVDIMNRSKISLHCHPVQLGLGFHERLFNASACETYSLVSNSTSIRSEFGDSFGYFNHSTFDDIADKVSYCLSHESQIRDCAHNAYEIVNARHTWTCRAKSILDIID